MYWYLFSIFLKSSIVQFLQLFSFEANQSAENCHAKKTKIRRLKSNHGFAGSLQVELFGLMATGLEYPLIRTLSLILFFRCLNPQIQLGRSSKGTHIL